MGRDVPDAVDAPVEDVDVATMPEEEEPVPPPLDPDDVELCPAQEGATQTRTANNIKTERFMDSS